MKDGSFGDLSSLAQRLSYSLLTYENDVLSALSQLRRRQLPANSYNDVAEMVRQCLNISILFFEREPINMFQTTSDNY